MVMKEHAEQSYHSNGMKWFNKNLDIKNRQQQPHDDIDREKHAIPYPKPPPFDK